MVEFDASRRQHESVGNLIKFPVNDNAVKYADEIVLGAIPNLVENCTFFTIHTVDFFFHAWFHGIAEPEIMKAKKK